MDQQQFYQFSFTLNNNNSNRKKIVSLGFISTSVGLVSYGRLIRDTNFIDSWELQAYDSQKLPTVQALVNPIQIFSINPSIILDRVFSLNVYKYPKFHQKYSHNRLKNHRHILNLIFLILSFEKSFQTLLKHNDTVSASEFFALNLHVSSLITNKLLFTSL